MENRELFERVAARILTEALDAFPEQRDFRSYEILEAEELDLSQHNFTLADSTLSWLHDEGFLRELGRGQPHDPTGTARLECRKSRLTVVGLAALNQTVEMSGQSSGERAGDFLKDQVKQSGGEARKAAISEIIEKIFGMAAAIASKAFLAGG